MIKVCLSHDIDRTHKTYQFLTKSISSLVKGNIEGIRNQFRSLSEKNQYWTFQDFIEIEQAYNIRSTVFFLNESIKLNVFKPGSYKLALGRYQINDPEIVKVIKWLDINGWEIGVHGSFNSYRDPELMYNEKKALENIVEHPVIGIRQHYLNLNESTWKYQRDLGFLYDSSWGHTDAIGFKNEKFVPFHPLNDDFIVFPLVLMDTCFMGTRNKWDEFDKLLDVCKKKGSVLVINFHQHVFNKYDFPGFKEAYISMLKILTENNATFLTLAQMVEDY